MGEYSKKTVGVVLAGCGFLDGSEIHEATLTLLALDRAGVKIICMAPDVPHAHVINHLTAKAVDEQRHVLHESARIARGAIHAMRSVSPDDLDAIIFPGGYGAAKNLFTFAFHGINGTVNQEVERFITTLHSKKRPQGFLCISPVIAAKVLGMYQPELTIGNDEATAAAIIKMGGNHINRKVDEIVVDEKNRLVSTPAYMFDTSIAHVARGIDKLVSAVLEMA
ncbi:isoprenoid biosynthesis glyoxalase ElbB [candidate division KSB1 bacterium]|nr:isoprenoid biosynthesis glyoxalase ElbB [candidate division KSB1 bacterium]